MTILNSASSSSSSSSSSSTHHGEIVFNTPWQSIVDSFIMTMGDTAGIYEKLVEVPHYVIIGQVNKIRGGGGILKLFFIDYLIDYLQINHKQSRLSS